MNNRQICEYVRDIYKNTNGEKYIAEVCAEEGYGQPCGGYLEAYAGCDTKEKTPSQKEHFLDFYGKKDKEEKLPSYCYLGCPQLLLFIAEIAGVTKERLEDAYSVVKACEDTNNLRNKQKNGNYMWGRQEFRDFKMKLQITTLVKIIRQAKKWDDVKEQVAKL